MDFALPVLIVDDFRTMTMVMCKLVGDIGFTDIDQVNNGAAALDKIREKKYGLILSDWDMRPMNGTELVRNIRKDPQNSDALIIMVAAQADPDGSWASGADGYLFKPFKPDDLKAKIENLMSRRAKHDALAGE